MRRVLDRVARPGERDGGQVMILTIGFVVVVLLLVLVVTDATAVHLERKRLLALTDLAALEAADALADGGYFAPGAGQGDPARGGVPLTDASVRAAVEAYLRDEADAGALDGLTVLSATSPDGRSAQVRLGAVAHPPLVTWVLAAWTDGISMEAVSVARAS